MIRKHEKPLEQIIKRYQEYITFSNEPTMSTLIPNFIEYKKLHNNGPIVNNDVISQFKIAIFNNVKININLITDCYIGFTKEDKLNIYKVFNIYHNKNNGENIFIT